MATMECEKHERLLQGMCDLLKDVQTDLSITEKDMEELLDRQMSQPYNPDDRLIADVVDSNSTSVSDVDTPLDHSADKPLRRVRPLQRQQSEPDSPNQMLMSKFYFRSMSNPCVCIPNLSSRLMKFDKHILSFLHKIDKIAVKINQLVAVDSVTLASISMKPFARFIHSVNTTYNYVEYLLDMTTYRKSNSQLSQTKENVEDIERAMTFGSSFLKSNVLTCRCCSNCVWIIRMFSGTSLRKIQNLKRQSVQQRAQLMKLTKDSTVEMESPPFQRKDFMSQQLQTTTDSTTTQRNSQHNVIPNYNVKPVTVSGVHDSYRMIPKQEVQIRQPSPLSSPGNQPWYSPLVSTHGDESWQQQHVLSPENIPWHPSPVPSNLQLQPPMVPPRPPTSIPGHGNTTPPFHLSPPLFGPRSREPAIMTRGSFDLRRQCIALRDEDPLHVLSSEMRDRHIGLPFGGNSLQDQDYRHLPPFEMHNSCPTPPDHQRRYHRNFHRDHNYRSFARRPFRRNRHSNRNVQHDRHPSPGSVTTHYFMQPLPEVDFTSTPSQSAPLLSSSPNPSWSYPAHEQNMDPTSPFFASRSRPVGQEMTASTTCEPSRESPSSRPPWVHTDHKKDHYTSMYGESDTPPPQGTSIPAIINHKRPASVHAVRHPSVGSGTILVSPPSSRVSRDMVQDTVPISSPPLNGPKCTATSYLPSTSIPRPPTNMMTDSSPPSNPPCLMPRSTKDTRQVIDETVNVKTCSTFSIKSFNPLHKARKFMTKCKELTSRKKQIKLGDAGSSPWQQEDGFQWVELNGKDPSPSSSTTKKEMLKGLGSSPLVEQGLKSPSNRRSSQAKPTVSTTSSNLMVAGSSPNTSTSPRLGQSIVKKTSGGRSQNTPSSPRVRQSSGKKIPEGRSPKAPVSPRGCQSSANKMSESSSPKTPVSPRGGQSSVNKTSEGKSLKMPSSPRVSQRIMKKMKVEDVSLSDHLGMTQDGNRMTQQDKSSAKPSILTSKKPFKPGQRPPSRKDIELLINSVKNGELTEPRTSSSPAVLRLPLKFESNEPSSNSTESIDIPTKQSSPRIDTSCCPKSEHCVTSPEAGSRYTTPHDKIKILPCVQPEHSSMPSDMKSQGLLGAEEISPVSVLKIQRRGPKADVIESKNTLTHISSGQRPVASLASSPGPVRRIAHKRQLLATYTLPVTLSVSPSVPIAKENRVVTLTSASSLINTTRVNAIQTSTPKPQMSTARICQQAEIVLPSSSNTQHVQLRATNVSSDSRYSQTILPKTPEPIKSTQWISRPSKVSLIPPRLVMKITKNAEITDTYSVSSIQTTAGTPSLQLTNVKYEQRSTSVSTSSSTSITSSVVVTSPFSTPSQSITTSQGIATLLRPTTSQDAATFLGDTTTFQAPTSQGSATTPEAATSLEPVALHDKTSDSGSSTPDRLVIVTNGNLDDEFDMESHQSASSSKGPSIKPVMLDNPTSAATRLTVSSPSATVVSFSEQPLDKQKETPSQQINKPCSTSRLKRSCAANSPVPFGTFGITSDTSTSTVVPSSLSYSSSKNLPGWTAIELPVHSSRIPTQVTRNKMFLSSKLSSNVPGSSGPVSVRPHATLKDKWKDILTERTMTEVMSTIGGSSRKSDSDQVRRCPKIVTDVRMGENPSKWPNVINDLPAEDHKCCNSVKDILAEETLNKNLQHLPLKVHISRKRLRPIQTDVNWVIQDKEYISSHGTDNVGTPPKRRQWSSGMDTLRTGSSEVTIQSGGNVSNNQSHHSQETIVGRVVQKMTTKHTPVQITCEEKPSTSKSVGSTSTSQKKPLGKVMPTHLTIRYDPLRKLRDTPPIAFQGKINEKKVREILLFSKVCVKNAYDYQTCQILPAAIATASNHVSPRYFARELVFMVFTIGELQGRKIESQNRRFRRMQSQILNPTKISAVKDVVLHRFPIEEFHWSERCIPFINDSLKTLFQRKLTHSAFQWIAGIQDCFHIGGVAELVQ
ncbi:mucin-5AC-like isoform X2 [Mizuhopecten yessoensis]|nr:mucin-5AC-like isoform X2 [Mizuhopecten yessoensis]